MDTFGKKNLSVTKFHHIFICKQQKLIDLFSHMHKIII